MAYKALYRTYRPTTFDEVAGQQHIVKTLKNALATNKIAHAYLFAGPRGTGKTTMAKIFAKALNCEEGFGHQCNTCKNCLAVNEGNHPDVIELDAASNNGVDEIRNLIDKVKYGTSLGKYKVYIIDEVHMLSTPAFNALLKTLEEPPAHVVFILATTEPHEIIPTILSRCQRYDFTKVSNDDIKERIRTILDSEQISFNEEAVNLIISLCDGGMRDALSILDQVLAYSGNTLNVEDILDIFSLESKEEKINLIKSIGQSNIVEVLNKVNAYFEKGTDIKRLTDDLLTILKDVLIYQNTNSGQYLEVLTKEEADDLCGYVSLEKVMKMIDELMSAQKDIKNVSAINPLFEVTILKMMANTPIEKEMPKIETKKEIITKQIEDEKPIIIKEEIKPIEEKPIEEKPSPVVEETFSNANVEMLSHIIVLKDSKQDDKYFISDEVMINVMATSKKDMKTQIMEKWQQLKRFTLHPVFAKVSPLLLDSHPLVVSNKIIIIECQTKKMVEKINDVENQKILQTLLNEAFGNNMFIYAVDRLESVRFQGIYMNLRQINKLPKEKEIVLEFEEE